MAIHPILNLTDFYRLATRNRNDLIVDGRKTLELAAALEEKTSRLFGPSLKLRQVSAGGCNACEADRNVLPLIGRLDSLRLPAKT